MTEKNLEKITYSGKGKERKNKGKNTLLGETV